MKQLDIPQVVEHYNTRNNYLIQELGNSRKVCAIYFSSNAIYHPNDSATFEKLIVEGDRYDWYSTRVRRATKHIFLRDIYKQWYVEGINRHIPSHEALADFLREETFGYQVITIGSSAGGYAAVLFGCLLNASLVFAFSCQFSLIEHILLDEEKRSRNPLIVKYAGDYPRNKYYNLTNLIKESEVPIFYFMPTESAQDVAQYNLIKELPQIFTLKIIDNTHGVPLYHFSLSDTINSSLKMMQGIYKNIANNNISKYEYASLSSGFIKTNILLMITMFRNTLSRTSYFLKWNIGATRINKCRRVS